MLFNSYIFIFVFLPITLLGFHVIGSQGRHKVALAWLVAASLFFYGWWNPAYLGLILGSMLFNYAMGVALSSRAGISPPPPPAHRLRPSWSQASPPTWLYWAITSTPTSSLKISTPYSAPA